MTRSLLIILFTLLEGALIALVGKLINKGNFRPLSWVLLIVWLIPLGIMNSKLTTDFHKKQQLDDVVNVVRKIIETSMPDQVWDSEVGIVDNWAINTAFTKLRTQWPQIDNYLNVDNLQGRTYRSLYTEVLIKIEAQNSKDIIIHGIILVILMVLGEVLLLLTMGATMGGRNTSRSSSYSYSNHDFNDF